VNRKEKSTKGKEQEESSGKKKGAQRRDSPYLVRKRQQDSRLFQARGEMVEKGRAAGKKRKIINECGKDRGSRSKKGRIHRSLIIEKGTNGTKRGTKLVKKLRGRKSHIRHS